MNEGIFSGRLYKDDNSLYQLFRIFGVILFMIGLVVIIGLISTPFIRYPVLALLIVILVAIPFYPEFFLDQQDDKNIYLGPDRIVIGDEIFAVDKVENNWVYIEAYNVFFTKMG